MKVESTGLDAKTKSHFLLEVWQKKEPRLRDYPEMTL